MYYILEAYTHTMIQWRRVAKQDLTVYTWIGPVRLLTVLKSYDFGSHCLEQSESEGAVQSLVERERKGWRKEGRNGESEWRW